MEKGCKEFLPGYQQGHPRTWRMGLTFPRSSLEATTSLFLALNSHQLVLFPVPIEDPRSVLEWGMSAHMEAILGQKNLS